MIRTTSGKEGGSNITTTVTARVGQDGLQKGTTQLISFVAVQCWPRMTSEKKTGVSNRKEEIPFGLKLLTEPQSSLAVKLFPRLAVQGTAIPAVLIG